MKIGEFADAAGVSCDTIRFYERRGLISSDRRTNGYRDFSEDMLILVQTIRLAQKLGFSLKEIGAIVLTLNAGTLPEEDVADLLRKKISEIEAKANDLLQLRDVLTTRLNAVCPLNLGQRHL